MNYNNGWSTALCLSLLLHGIFLCSCRPSAPRVVAGPSSRQHLDQAEALYGKGALLAALGHARAVAVDDSGYGYALELQRLLEDEITTLANFWGMRGRRLLKQMQYTKALHALKQALAYELLPAQQRQYRQHIESCQQLLAQTRSDYRELQTHMRTALASGDSLKAQKVITRAQLLQKRLQPDTFDAFTLTMRQLIKLRAFSATVQQNPSVPKRRKGRKALKVQRPVHKATESPLNEKVQTADLPESDEDPLPLLLATAKRKQRKGEIYDAIVLFRRVVARDVANTEARAALKRLEPQRVQLIKKLEEKSGRHLVRQELEKALPYFRRIIAIDPGNARALQGIQMYENLERIKSESKQ